MASAGEIHRDVEPRQWRAELVRDVLQKLPFGGQERANAVGHLVERSRKFTDFVLAF